MIVLSVHLITYNNENHIVETIESILKQKTDFKYEIVVGDDCSTDKTFTILTTYAKTHPQLFDLKRNEHQLGILQNFKSTLDRCKGTYVFDIAGDDILKQDYSLQKMVDALKNNPFLGFVDSGFDSFYESNDKLIPFKNKSILNGSKTKYKEALLLGEVAPIGHCYRKEYIYKYVDFDKYLSMKLTIEDYPILVDMVMNTDFERISESLHIYRIHDNSHSHQKNFEELVNQKKQMKILFDYFSKKYDYSEKIKNIFNINYNKMLLFYAGYFSNKNLGKEAYKNIESKSLKDVIHYLASQNYTFRKLISKTKKLTNI